MSLECFQLTSQEKKSWYVLHGDQPRGPYSFLDLIKFENDGQLSLKNTIWSPESRKGISFRELKQAYDKNPIPAHSLPTQNQRNQISEYVKLAISLCVILFCSVTIYQLKTHPKRSIIHSVKISPPQLKTDEVRTQNSSVANPSVQMRLETLNMLMLQTEDNFEWILKKKFSVSLFNQSVQRYQTQIGIHLTKFHQDTETEFAQLSKKLSPQDVQLHDLLKVNLVAKKMGALTMEYIQAMQQIRPQQTRSAIVLTQNWLKQMNTYRQQRFGPISKE